MEYKFYGALNFDDYLQFQDIVNPTFFTRRKKLITIIICFLTFLSFLFFLLSGNGFVLLAFLLILPMVLFSGIIKKYDINKRTEVDANNKFREYCEYIINDDKIVTNSDSSNFIVNKENLYKIMFYKDTIYIFMAGNVVKAIKKRFLEKGTKYNDVIQFIKDKYKEKIM